MDSESPPPHEDASGASTTEEVEALRRELLRTRRDNAQFQLKVKHLSHALEGVAGQRHEAELEAIRSHILENRALGPLVYEGVRVSVSSDAATHSHAASGDAVGGGAAPDISATAVPNSSSAPPMHTSTGSLSSADALPRAQTRSRAVRVGQTQVGAAQPAAHFVVNSFAALDVSSRLAAGAPGGGRRAGAAAAGGVAAPAGVRAAAAAAATASSSSSSWAEVYGVGGRGGAAAAGGGGGSEGLPTPPRASPPGTPARSQSAKGKARVRAHDWGADDGRVPEAPGAAPGMNRAFGAAVSDPRPSVTAASDAGNGRSGGGEDEDDEDAPPPPPLGSPSSPSSLAPPPPELTAPLPRADAAPPAPSLRAHVLLSPPPAASTALRRHSSTSASPARSSPAAEADVVRLQALVHALRSELDALRGRFAATVEQARAEGGDAAAVEIGEFYEGVVADHSASLKTETSKRMREEAKAAAAEAQLAAVRAELVELRSVAASAAKLQANGSLLPQSSQSLPPPATRSPTPVSLPQATAAGSGGGSSSRDEIEYMRLHYENEMALAAERAAAAQDVAVAAVRSALQGQLDDLNAIFDSQLADAIAQARIEAHEEARIGVEQRIAVAVAEAVSAAQRQADAERIEAVRSALASAAGDFKAQLTSALSTLRDNLLSEKTALRAALEAEKQREVEAHVAAARGEYEAVMNRYEQSTEAWRRDTVAACERSLDAARLQVSDARALSQTQAAEIVRLKQEIAQLQLQKSPHTGSRDAVHKADGAEAPDASFVGSRRSSAAVGGGGVASSTASAAWPSASAAAGGGGVPIASPRNIAAAKAYAAALAAEGAAAAPAQAGATTSPPQQHEQQQYATRDCRSGSTSEAGQASGTPPRDTDQDVSATPEAGAPPRPHGVSVRLYTTILNMSVSALKGMLTRAGIPHADCREKNDLRERLLLAVDKGQSLSPGGSHGPSSSGVSPLSAAAHAAARGSAAATQNDSFATDASEETDHGHGLEQTDAVPAASRPRADSASIGGAFHDGTSSSVDPSSQLGADPVGPAASSSSSASGPRQASSPQELKNWLPARAPDGAVYYYHRITRAVRWDKPEADVAKKMEARIQGEHEAVKMRQAERLADLEAASAEAARHAALKSRVEAEVDSRVKQWARGKSVRQMLSSLHAVLTARAGGALPDYGAAAAGNPEELKKAYFKAIRLVHPDKVAPSAPLEAQVEAQKVFAALSDAYKRYTDSEAAGGGGGLGSFTSAAPGGRRPGGAGADVPSFGGFGAGASGVSGAAARARAAFNAMHSATRGGAPPPAAQAATGVGAGSGGAAAAGGVRFAPFGVAGPPGAYTGATGSSSWGGSFTSRFLPHFSRFALSASPARMTVADEVAALRDSAFFNEATIPLLEKFVNEESSNAVVYSGKANRGLLKLYQMFPARLNLECVVAILVKSLAALPEPDFLLASYLVPESFRASAELATLSELERLLQVGQFVAFWARAKEDGARTLLARVEGIDEAVRAFVARAIERTYQRVSLADLGAALDTMDAEAFARAQGWQVDGSEAALPLSPENTQRPKQPAGQDGAVKYSEIAGLISSLSR